MSLPWVIEGREFMKAMQARHEEEERTALRVKDMEVGDWAWICPWEVDEETLLPSLSARIYGAPTVVATTRIDRMAEDVYMYSPSIRRKKPKRWYEFWK